VEDGTIQWVDQSGLPLGQTERITHAQEDGESGQKGGEGDGGVQAGNTAKRQTRTRKRPQGEKP
jgi:hypothetical protein